MELFGKEISLRTHYCRLFDNELEEVKEPYINLVIRFKGCNAKCKFCEFQNDAAYFDELKFAIILNQLKEKVKINKINFTGGEPTLDYNKFKKVVAIAQQISPKSFFVLNSNGLNINKVLTDISKNSLRIDNVSLSRHHYIDKRNNKILGFNSIKACKIKSWNKQLPNLLHLSCNLIKGHIDDKEKVYTYLEKASELGITSVGFVSLMPINQYCKDNFVDFREMKLESNRFNLTRQYTYCDMCTCNNYFYIPENTKKLIMVYTKNTYKPFDITTSLVFDGRNLKQGYGNDIIC